MSEVSFAYNECGIGSTTRYRPFAVGSNCGSDKREVGYRLLPKSEPRRPKHRRELTPPAVPAMMSNASNLTKLSLQLTSDFSEIERSICASRRLTLCQFEQ